MNIKNVLLFIGGVVIGATGGVFGTKKYFQNKYQKRYEEDHKALEQYYHQTDRYYRVDHGEDIPIDTDSVCPSRATGMMSAEQRKKVKEQLNAMHGTKTITNYSGMYKGVEPAESEHPLDQGEEGEVGPEDLKICANCENYDGEYGKCVYHENEVSADAYICSDFTPLYHSDKTADEEAFDEHQKNKDKPPRIISAEAYGDLPASIDQNVLYFYAYDEVLVDENDEMVEEPERLVGDSLTKYGFADNDERIIFVMNYSLDTCYEIQKIDASWTDSH